MGRRTLTLGYAVTIADLVLAPFTPSNTARSGGTVFPVIRNLPGLYDSGPPLVSRADASAQVAPRSPVASAAPAASPAPAVARTPSAPDLAKKHACLACHGINNKIVGPSFAEIGNKYKSRSDAEVHVASRIKAGGGGVWGAVPMPAQPQLKDDEALALARWIVQGAR